MVKSCIIGLLLCFPNVKTGLPLRQLFSYRDEVVSESWHKIPHCYTEKVRPHATPWIRYEAIGPSPEGKRKYPLCMANGNPSGCSPVDGDVTLAGYQVKMRPSFDVKVSGKTRPILAG